MRQNIGKIWMVVGALLILAASALLAYNKWDAARADKAAQQALGELEQTYHLEKIFRTDRRSCDMRNEICMYKFRAIDIHNP